MGRDARRNPQSLESDISAMPVVLDRLGRPLNPGDQVLFFGLPPHTILDVQEVSPVLDPSAPRNTCRLILTTRINFVVKAQQPVGEIVLVRPEGTGGWRAGSPTEPASPPTQARRPWWRRLLRETHG